MWYNTLELELRTSTKTGRTLTRKKVLVISDIWDNATAATRRVTDSVRADFACSVLQSRPSHARSQFKGFVHQGYRNVFTLWSALGTKPLSLLMAGERVSKIVGESPNCLNFSLQESRVTFSVRYLESLAWLPKVQRRLPELLHVTIWVSLFG